MNLREWIRNEIMNNETTKSKLYDMYNDACIELDKQIPIESYTRTVRAMYNELMTDTNSSELVEFDSNEITNAGTVLVVGDIHIPFENPKYLEFCKQQYDKWNCKTVVFIGDIVDLHSLSYHEHDPDGLSPKDELEHAVIKLKNWYKVFPNAYVCFGNHDILVSRRGITHGLPKRLFKSLGEIIEAPKGWKFNYSWHIDGVKYMHGTGGGGQNAHVIRALKNRQSTVIGHFHSVLGVRYLASHKDLIFGMQVGCGISISSYAMEYGKDFIDRPVLGCGIVVSDKEAYTVPMNLKGS